MQGYSSAKMTVELPPGLPRPSSLRGGAIRDEGASPEGVVDNPNDLLVSASTEILVRDIIDSLLKRYPGFIWAIQPDERGGIFNIFCTNFSSKWGYTIKIADIQHDAKRVEAMRAGGEILRRFGYPADKYDLSLDRAYVRRRPGSNEAIPNLTGVKSANVKQQTQAEVELAIVEGRAEVVTRPDGTQVIQVPR